MKSLKEPKTFKYPRLYVGIQKNGELDNPRIVYPSGRGDWGASGWCHSDGTANVEYDFACWVAGEVKQHRSRLSEDLHRPELAFKSLRNMKKYLKQQGLDVLFLGEIK